MGILFYIYLYIICITVCSAKGENKWIGLDWIKMPSCAVAQRRTIFPHIYKTKFIKKQTNKKCYLKHRKLLLIDFYFELDFVRIFFGFIRFYLK